MTFATTIIPLTLPGNLGVWNTNVPCTCNSSISTRGSVCPCT